MSSRACAISRTADGRPRWERRRGQEASRGGSHRSRAMDLTGAAMAATKKPTTAAPPTIPNSANTSSRKVVRIPRVITGHTIARKVLPEAAEPDAKEPMLADHCKAALPYRDSPPAGRPSKVHVGRPLQRPRPRAPWRRPSPTTVARLTACHVADRSRSAPTRLRRARATPGRSATPRAGACRREAEEMPPRTVAKITGRRRQTDGEQHRRRQERSRSNSRCRNWR